MFHVSIAKGAMYLSDTDSQKTPEIFLSVESSKHLENCSEKKNTITISNFTETQSLVTLSDIYWI